MKLIDEERNRRIAEDIEYCASELYKDIFEKAVELPKSNEYSIQLSQFVSSVKVRLLENEKLDPHFYDNVKKEVSSKFEVDGIKCTFLDNNFVTLSEHNPQIEHEKQRIFWSRSPGKFVNQFTGEELDVGYEFSGTVRDWYGTLIEQIQSVCKTMYDAYGKEVTKVVTNPNVMCIIESSFEYTPRCEYPNRKPASGTITSLLYKDIKVEAIIPGPPGDTIEIYCDKDGIRHIQTIEIKDYKIT